MPHDRTKSGGTSARASTGQRTDLDLRLRAKAQQVKRFLAAASHTHLERKSPGSAVVTVVESLVIAAIIAICADYGLDEPTTGMLEEIRPAVLATHRGELGRDRVRVKVYEVDLQVPLDLERRAHENLRRAESDLADVNLFEVELEMKASEGQRDRVRHLQA